MTIHWKNWCRSWNSNTLVTWCKELTQLKRPWCWERLKAGGEGDDRGWDGWMASVTLWTNDWLNSRSWWLTGRLGMLQSMGLQRVGHNWVTILHWIYCWLSVPNTAASHCLPTPLLETPAHSGASLHQSLLNCGVEEDSWESLGLQGDPTSPS